MKYSKNLIYCNIFNFIEAKTKANKKGLKDFIIFKLIEKTNLTFHSF